MKKIVLFALASLVGMISMISMVSLVGCGNDRQASLLVYDQPILDQHFKNYRDTDTWYAEALAKTENKTDQKSTTAKINTIGLNELHISASSQFSEQGLLKILVQAGIKFSDNDNRQPSTPKMIVIDLRQEPHGFIDIIDDDNVQTKIITGIPVSWYAFRNQHSIGKTSKQIILEEQKLLAELQSVAVAAVHEFKKGLMGDIAATKTNNVKVVRAYNEEELVGKYNVGYKRLFILDHHKPSEKEVDEFVAFIKQIPVDTKLHFHCRGGVGRATTFMIMYDMIRNAQHVSMHDIITRQDALLKLVRTDKAKPKKTWKVPAALARKEFIEQFYSYVLDPKGYMTTTWSQWLQAN